MKICNNCGTQLEDNYRVCPNCGMVVTNEVQQPNLINGVPNYIEQYQNIQRNKTNTVALVGLVLSIISLLIFPFILGLAGASCGFSGVSQINKTGEKGKGYAIASIVIGIFSIGYAIYYTINHSS